MRKNSFCSFDICSRLTFPSFVADVFYYLETENYAEPLALVSMSKQYITTKCCKEITFISVPSYIYADINKYSTGNLQNVFVFSLSPMPSVGVTIIPMMLNKSTTLPLPVGTMPSKLEFSTIISSGSFFFHGSPDMEGVYVVALNVSGPSAHEYFPVAPVPVRILSSYQPLPPPKFVSAIFAPDGQSIQLNFDVSTDMGGAGARAWSCSQLFSFPGCNASKCQWASSSTVQVIFPPSTTTSLPQVVPGTLVHVLARNIRALCLSANPTICRENEATPLTSLSVQPPSQPLLPTVVLNIPQRVSTCEDLVIDASGSFGNAGRSWGEIQWTIASDSNASLIQQTLNKAGTVERPIVIPRAVLVAHNVTVMLTLQNFLGATSSAQGRIEIVDNVVPSVQLLGAVRVAILPSQSLRVKSIAAIPNCSDISTSLVRMWSIRRGNVVVNDLWSTSLDPTVFLLPPYSLSVGYSYTLAITALWGHEASSASIEVSVIHGKVIAYISGGQSRRIPIDNPFELDASSSIDQDEQPNTVSSLKYFWSCTIVSVIQFGENCGSIFDHGSPSRPVAIVPSDTLLANTTYSFTVLVRSPDGRSDNKSVTVSSSIPGSVSVAIISKKYEINSGQTLSLTGMAFSNVSIVASWAVFFGSTLVEYSSSTPQQQIFTAAEAQSTINFPLAVPGNTFTPGSSLTFQLQGCFVSNPSSCNFAQVVIEIHSPPWNGFMAVNPQRGYSLATQFSLNALGWIADRDSYPLYYAFAFSRGVDFPSLTVATASLLTYSTATLPAGLQSSNFSVMVFGIVTDAVSASSNASTSVQVLNGEGVDVGVVVLTSMKAFSDTGDVNALFQVVNTVAPTLNTVSCLGSPNCKSLNRQPCTSVSNTCGPCLDGFSGVDGNSNIQCIDTSISTRSGPIGANCSANKDCAFGVCSNFVCTAPLQQCPSNDPRRECSGHGSCIYLDISGSVFDEPCSVLNVYCTPTCVCRDSFGGIDCSLSPSEVALADSTRTQLCQALLQAIKVQDVTSLLLDAIAGSLQQTYSPYEITSLEGNTACVEVLTFLAGIAQQGYLSTASSSTALSVARVISSFISSSPADNINRNASRQTAVSALDGLTSGILQAMVTQITCALFL